MADPGPEEVARAYHRGTLKGVERICALIESKSVPRAPHLTGYLRSTFYSEVDQEGEGAVPGAGDMTIGEVGYTADYAATQHEHTEFRHEDGEAKYLESALLEAIPEAPRMIAQSIEEELASLFAG